MSKVLQARLNKHSQVYREDSDTIRRYRVLCNKEGSVESLNALSMVLLAKSDGVWVMII